MEVLTNCKLFSTQGIISLVMLCTSDVYTLIDYAAFVESMFLMWSVAGLLWLRYKEPNLHRPIKVCNSRFHVMKSYRR
jgi:amino acid transporter